MNEQGDNKMEVCITPTEAMRQADFTVRDYLDAANSICKDNGLEPTDSTRLKLVELMMKDFNNTSIAYSIQSIANSRLNEY